MRRDDLANKAEVTNVTAFDEIYIGTSNETSTPRLPSKYPVFTDGFDNNGFYKSGNSTGLAGKPFYSSYDPEIGINTAIVLGGLLLVLVVYVVYRTKCRKRILRAIHKCTMKYFPEEFTPPEKRNSLEQTERQSNAAEAEWISESAKMIWQERAKLSQESDSGKCCATDQRKCSEIGHSECCAKGNEKGDSLDKLVEKNGEMNANTLTLRLPDTEENVERATAEWVQNVKWLDRKERQLNGIILKIPPDLVSNNAKVRSHFNSVTDYCESGDFVNISSRNKSLPLLIEQQSFVPSIYAKVNCSFKTQAGNCVDYAPIAAQDEFDIELEPRPSQLQVQHLSGTKVPLDICPIVKVQHFHSRSKRRLTSINRTSSEDSTNSSESSSVAEPTPTGQSKYIRLHTEENEACQQNDKVSFQNNNNVQKNVQKKCHTGNLETRL